MDFSLLGFSGIRGMYNIHPIFVHAPVALIPTALLFYALGVVRSSDPAFFAGRATLGLALVGSLVAVFTGLRAESTIPHNETIHHIMEMHEAFGFAVLSLIGGLVVWSAFHKDHRPIAPVFFLIALAIATALVFQGADLGARMVYLEGAAVRPAEPFIVSGLVRGGAHSHEQINSAQLDEDKGAPKPASGHSDPPGSPPHKH